MFTKSCDYGILATFYIANNSNEKKYVGLKEIADATSIPPHFLSKVLSILVKNKILSSTKGLNGGFKLKRNATKINMLDIIKAIDGTDIFDNCLLGLKECSDENPCLIHDHYKIIKEDFINLLSKETLQVLIEHLKNRENKN
ncbi:MAG: Rrf2 family transcriptional regulator [Ignavibacteriae bacterium]|nr:MAG: Rrf2 family transcriptional regulator [Ignavibacteriota bacterium]